MEPPKKLRIYEGATALITGGASGIGKAMAEALAGRGADVILADLQYEKACEVAEGIRTAGAKARAVQLDVTDYPAVQQVVADTFGRTGRLDFLFNNAGVIVSGGVQHLKVDDWNYILDINVRGVIHGVQAAYPLMLAQGFGHIVNTGSIAGLIPATGTVPYAMTKHAVVGLSKSLRGQAGLFGIRVSVLCPGVLQTEMLVSGGKYGRSVSNIDPETRRRMARKVKAMPADLFARRALDAVAKNKAIIVEPVWWRWLWRFDRLSPQRSILLSQKIFQRNLVKLGLWPPKI